MSDQLLPGVNGRRRSLDDIAAYNGSTNAGLWFDRYYKRSSTSNDQTTDKRTLITQTAALAVPMIYHTFFTCWRDSLPKDSTCAIAEVRGRMVIGTGDKGVVEVGMTLHQTYGVPYIPGSALKGLAAAYAHQRLEGDTWRKPPLQFNKTADGQAPPLSSHEILFGSARSAGYVTFFDALYIPDTASPDCPLATDVITGHHSEYYVSGTTPPADWDNPIPVPFLTATGRYLIVLHGEHSWITTALNIIGLALRESGIGAKTSSGYGRMQLLESDGTPFILLPSRESTPSAISSDAQRGQHAAGQTSNPQTLSAVPTGFVQQVHRSNAGSLPNLMSQWRNLSLTERAPAALLMIAHARTIKIKDLEAKPWYHELQTSVSDDEAKKS